VPAAGGRARIPGPSDPPGPRHAAPDRLRLAVAIARRPVRVPVQLLAWVAMVTVVVSLGSGAAIHTVRARQTAAATTTMAQDVVAVTCGR
jgi:hypothetical protein